MVVETRRVAEDHPTAGLDTDESENEAHSPGGKEPPAKKRLAEAKKKKRSEPEVADEELQLRGRGRPITTGEFAGKADAVARYNQQLKEKAALEKEATLRKLTIEEVFSCVESDMENAVAELKHAPTADVASRARESMGEVARIAKSSRNLKGTSVRTLKHAAVMAAAATETLRTRVDRTEMESEPLKQLEIMRRELEGVKKKAQKNEERARKEMAELREELEAAKAKIKKATGRRGRVYVEEDDDDSPPQSQDRGGNAAGAEESTAAAIDISGMRGMDVRRTPKYDDERRRQEIMPPPEEIPAAIRPAIRGKIKVLEDRKLDGHRVRMVKGAEGPTTRASAEGGRQGEIQPLMEQITQVLERLVQEKFYSLGLANQKEEGGGGGKPPEQGHIEEGQKEEDGTTPAHRERTSIHGREKGWTDGHHCSKQ